MDRANGLPCDMVFPADSYHQIGDWQEQDAEPAIVPIVCHPYECIDMNVKQLLTKDIIRITSVRLILYETNFVEAI